MNDSQSLLSLLAYHASGRYDARDLPNRFRAILSKVDALGIPAAFIGRVAYGRYAAAQFCEQIDVLLGMEALSPRWADTIAAVKAADHDASWIGSPVKLVVHPALNRAETSWIAQTQRVPWLGCLAPLASAEHLFVLFLLEGTAESHSLAIQTAMAHQVNPSTAEEIGSVLGITERALRAALQRAVGDKASRWRPDHGRDA